MNNRTRRTAPSAEELVALLKRHGLKATRQRIAVHNAMLKLGHASADMVAEEVSGDDTAKVTSASVYNILTQMAAIGVYGRRLSSNNKMYFDVNSFTHIHMYDSVNNTFRDIIDEELTENILARIGRKKFKGYRVEDIDIQIVCKPSGRGNKTMKQGR